MKKIFNYPNESSYQMVYVKGFSIHPLESELAFGEKVILNLNKVFHESELESLKELLTTISNNVFFGIVFSDLSVYMISKELGIKDKLIYDPNTLMTNYMDFNFWKEKGIFGVFVSPFLTKEDLNLIGEEKKLNFFFLGQGALNMFYSHRPLITNYLLSEGKEMVYENKQLFLKEETRNELYPIIEKEGEVLIYSPNQFMLNDEEILEKVDYLYLDDTFKELAMDEGFLHKKTVYRR